MATMAFPASLLMKLRAPSSRQQPTENQTAIKGVLVAGERRARKGEKGKAPSFAKAKTEREQEWRVT
jgi:hypothetical protein